MHVDAGVLEDIFCDGLLRDVLIELREKQFEFCLLVAAHKPIVHVHSEDDEHLVAQACIETRVDMAALEVQLQ
jgi:hypothetical protein